MPQWSHWMWSHPSVPQPAGPSAHQRASLPQQRQMIGVSVIFVMRECLAGGRVDGVSCRAPQHQPPRAKRGRGERLRRAALRPRRDVKCSRRMRCRAPNPRRSGGRASGGVRFREESGSDRAVPDADRTGAQAPLAITASPAFWKPMALDNCASSITASLCFG